MWWPSATAREVSEGSFRRRHGRQRKHARRRVIGSTPATEGGHRKYARRRGHWKYARRRGGGHRKSPCHRGGHRKFAPRRSRGSSANRTAQVDASARDEARSSISLAGAERLRSSLLSLGYCALNSSHRSGDARGWAVSREFLARLKSNYNRTVGKVADEATVASLVASMSGGTQNALMIPRRLVLAAERQQLSRQRKKIVGRAQLDVALQKASRASAVLDLAGMGRIITFFWKCRTRTVAARMFC